MAWAAMLRRLLRRTDTVTPTIAAVFQPAGLERPDAIDTIEFIAGESPRLMFPEPANQNDVVEWRPPGVVRNERMEALGEDLWGVSFAIEYRDARGQVTMRRITIRELYKADDGALYVHSFCHERKAARSFRFDRIISIIDLDGEVHQPRAFFQSELRLDVPEIATSSPSQSRRSIRDRGPAEPRIMQKPGYAQRAAARDGLRVLVALSRADGFLHEAELAIILDYVLLRAAAIGIVATADDRAALLPYLMRQFPSADVLDECVDRLEREPDELRQLFLDHAAALIDADGIQHPAEFDMLLKLKDRL